MKLLLALSTLTALSTLAAPQVAISQANISPEFCRISNQSSVTISANYNNIVTTISTGRALLVPCGQTVELYSQKVGYRSDVNTSMSITGTDPNDITFGSVRVSSAPSP
jgi:hypothetical protein